MPTKTTKAKKPRAKKAAPRKSAKKWSFADHPEAEAKLEAHCRAWIANALSTAPIDEADRLEICDQLRAYYGAAKLAPPDKVIVVPSPLVAMIAGTIAAGAIWLLADRDRQMLHCQRPMSVDDMRAAIARACEIAIDPTKVKNLPRTYAATDAATDAATRAATDAATHAATDAATHAATDAATHAATDAATDAATRAATDAATYAATDAATDAATHAATRAATDAATYAATDAATRAATHAATYAATRAATDAATHARAGDLDHAVYFLLMCTHKWHYSWNGGNDWSAWASYLSFGRSVGRTDIDWACWIPYERLAQLAGPRFVHPTFAMVSERPTVMKYRLGDNGQAILHSEDGPAKQWGDGWSLWFRDGARERITLEHVTPRATIAYHLADGAYVRQESATSDEIAAAWARKADELRPVDDRLYNDAEQQMLIWAA